MKKKNTTFFLICLLLTVFIILSFGCSPNNEQNTTPKNEPKEDNPIGEANGDLKPVNGSETPPVAKPVDLNEYIGDSDFERDKLKYYQYFNQHNSRIRPIFAYTGKLDKDTENNLMTFAIMNLNNYSYEEGNSKEEIDEVLKKYFGQTVKNYQTAATEYLPGTQKIRAVGWSFHGALRLVLTKLVPEEDGSLTGFFDVYYIHEMFSFDNPEDWQNLDKILLSDDRSYFSDLLSNKVIINFNELSEPDGDFYLKYNTIKLLEMDTPLYKPYIEDELDKKTFDPSSRFSADEATFNSITLYTSKKELVKKLGEPFDIIEEDGEAYLPSTSYVYAGVEYVFEGDSDTVTYIMVTNYQWKYGPRNIRIGDSFEDVLARFPQEQDYKTHPESCFYGETTYHNEGGAVYLDYDGNVDHIILVTKEVLPFMKIYFKDNKVSNYVIYGSTT